MNVLLASALLFVGCSPSRRNPTNPDPPPPNGSDADTSLDANPPFQDTNTEDVYVSQDTGEPAFPPSDWDDGPPPTQLLSGSMGYVGHIIDGDTLDVLVGRASQYHIFKVRLLGVDAPECHKQQDGHGRYACYQDDDFYGQEAYLALVSLLENARVRVVCEEAQGSPCERDYWDRSLAYIEKDGLDISTQLARLGAGFSYTRYPATRRAAICRAEDYAKEHGIGMWATISDEEVIESRGWYTNRDRLCREAVEAAN